MNTIDVTTIACLLSFSVNATFSAEGLQEIRYKSTADGSDQPAMFFAPETENAVPLLVVLHTWSGNYRQDYHAESIEWCMEKDWAVIQPNFRGPNRNPEATGSDLVIEDIVSAVAHATQATKIDSSRIYLLGTSGGGYTALLMAGRRPDLWAGVSAWVPISDLVAWYHQTKASGVKHCQEIVDSCGGLPGASEEVDRQYQRRSPLMYLANAKDVPLDINTGIRDGHEGDVPISHSLRAFNAVAAAADRITASEIEYFVDKAAVPPSLKQPLSDPTYGEKRPLFRRTSGNARITIFDGKHEWISRAALSWLEQQQNNPAAWNRPLAQDYVIVHQVRELNQKDRWVCVGSPDILRLPSGRLLASMELWLKTPTSGIEGGIDYPNHCLIKASDDGGKTWHQIGTTGVTWGSLFTIDESLYLIGNDPNTRFIIITRSTDGGRTWSKMSTLYDDSHYHGSATTVVVKDGFVYRAFEDADQGSASLVLAGDTSQDLLEPSAWRMSNKVEPPRQTPSLSRHAARHIQGRDLVGNWFLEGNVVEIRDQLVVLLRTRIDAQLTSGMTSICHLEDNGRQMRYRFVQFYPMIGGQNKFKLLYDNRSHLYWTCTAFVPDPYQDPEPLEQIGFKGNPANMRRILLLNYSLDGLNWLPAGCVAMSRNPLESFHYSSQVVDGDDLLVLSRSSVGGRPPYNNHDSNRITLHRVRNFRSLALDLKPVLPDSPVTQ